MAVETPAQLTDVLRFVKGVGPDRAEAFARLGIESVADLLRHFPRRYEDRRDVRPIGQVAEGEAVTVGGVVLRVRQRRAGPRSILTVTVGDATGTIDLLWFHGAHLAEWIRAGLSVWAYGEPKTRGRTLRMEQPEIEVDTGDEDASYAHLHLQRIVPIYGLSRGLHQRFVRSLVDRCLPLAARFPTGPFERFHPDAPDVAQAYRSIHFPDEFAAIAGARRRFIFEGQFRFATAMLDRRGEFRGRDGPRLDASPALDAKIRSIFPYRFTAEQDRVVDEIARDLAGPAPMYRLLAGDVGTGKTAIAIYALLVGVRSGWQGALLAPTEILAEQHARTIGERLAAYPVRVELITGALRGSRRHEVLGDLVAGRVHIAVGTQALLQDDVGFARLGVVVIDEQHRFGVEERRRLREKGDAPHVLVLSATPIPRSLARVLYGDLDLSTLRERPPGRSPVETRLIGGADRRSATELVRRELAAGRQAYFIYPLVEETEESDLPAAIERHRRLSEEVFPGVAVGLLHGRLGSEEKDRELERFRRGETRILVSTVVVEVGIDVPNATVMVIEDASRFGLAQLHQLRGRVGRGEHRGYCLVGLEGAKAEARERLEVFARTEDGFELAEADLVQRGPGDYLGRRQAGRPRPVLGSPLADPREFARVRDLAERFWADPAHAVWRERWREFLLIRPEEGGPEID